MCFTYYAPGKPFKWLSSVCWLLFTITVGYVISACASTPQKSANSSSRELQQQLPALHQWNDRELSLLKNLWIGNLSKTPPHANRNRVAGNPDAIALGHKLFFDRRFSSNGQVACASCHKPELYFTDGLRTAQGVGETSRNAPTIVGASYNNWYFHDGRADSLWSQALGPLENMLEHGGNRMQYVHIIFNDPDLRTSYEKLYGSLPDLSDRKRFPISAGPSGDEPAKFAWKNMSAADRKTVTDIFVNLGKVIAAYERQINPAPSRFDVYVKAVLDNDTAFISSTLSDDEVTGLRLFITKAQCTICHTGPMFTDFEFHNIRTVTMPVKTPDVGRYDGAKQVLESEFNCRSDYNDASDRSCSELKFIVTSKHDTVAAFKTPSLRNVSKTAPYMHAGQYQTLSEVLKHYNDPPKKVIGESDLLFISLTETEMSQLQDFLLTLDSPVDAPPELLAPLSTPVSTKVAQPEK